MSTDAAARESRASGLTPAEEATNAVSQQADALVEDDVLPEERDRWSRFPGFARMRTDWASADDRATISRVQYKVNEMVGEVFSDAFALMHELYDLVRTTVGTDKHGLPIWERTATGNFVEDWARLTTKQREHYLFQITTRMFHWEQKAADVWAEAMFSKALWEDAFALGYESLPAISATRPTVDDRNARARLASREHRYFAIYKTYYSRRVDGVVSALTLLGQRLKDVHAPNGR